MTLLVRDLRPGVPPAVELRTTADFADAPRPLFDLDARTVRDEPGDVSAEMTDYDAWVREGRNHPLLDREPARAGHEKCASEVRCVRELG
ncbi:hypothetical protein [Streptomyces sp. AGS-58]|uniref:hypothetical protein n=1 Tax=unclassified Streptomyces TaxID=2593676 RepID=UPI0035A2D1BE